MSEISVVQSNSHEIMYSRLYLIHYTKNSKYNEQIIRISLTYEPEMIYKTIYSEFTLFRTL